jgi:hypothetical protein
MLPEIIRIEDGIIRPASKAASRPVQWLDNASRANYVSKILPLH